MTLRAALKPAVRAGLWLGNPAAVLPVSFAPEYRPRTRFLAAKELSGLLGALLRMRFLDLGAPLRSWPVARSASTATRGRFSLANPAHCRGLGDQG